MESRSFVTDYGTHKVTDEMSAAQLVQPHVDRKQLRQFEVVAWDRFLIQYGRRICARAFDRLVGSYCILNRRMAQRRERSCWK